MSAVDRWARKDATRIHRRILHLAWTTLDHDEIDYLRRHAVFVLSTSGDLPAGWTGELTELVELLNRMDQRALEEGSP